MIQKKCNMMNEEEYIKAKIGSKNPFTVPNGYFEQLSDRIMSQLPEEEIQTRTVEMNSKTAERKKATVKGLRPWMLAAACICAAVFTVGVIFSNKHQENEAQPSSQVANVEATESNTYYSDKYIEDEADYAMLDNQDIYEYLLAEM